MKVLITKYLCLFGVLLLSLSNYAQELSPGELRKAEILEFFKLGTGTGKTTGHVANVVLHNAGTEERQLTLGPFLIPSNGKHQGYLIPDTTELVIAAGESAVVKLNGYCTNINLKPTPLDDTLAPFENWAIPDGTYATTQEDWQIPAGYFLNVSQELGDFPYKVTYPGTEKTFIYSVEFDKHPSTSADLLLLSHDLVEEQYLLMERLNTIRTPYSNNLERQKEALIQHTFWIYTSSLIGDAYTKEEFRKKMSEQFLTLVGDQKNRILETQFEGGVDDFWNGFLKLAKAAKIFKVAE